MKEIIGSFPYYPKQFEDFEISCGKIELWLSTDELLLQNAMYVHLCQNPPVSPDFDTFMCYLSMAAGCKVEQLLPRGEIVSRPTRFYCVSSNPRTQTEYHTKIRRLLLIQKPSNLSKDERNNLMFAIFRILADFEEPKKQNEIIYYLQCLLDETEDFDNFAQMFSQVSDDIAKLHKIALIFLPDIKLVLRLILETLIAVTQRSEFSTEIPNFEMKTRPYCGIVIKMIDKLLETEKWSWKENLENFLEDIRNQFR
ncbi:unnamed protein product [Caenorhabditis angaria]|uniref:Uncharacterized protein n=1 Tax=Caenorhabditis angaria TaxID=860376 RepID=A0A9P1IA85_9PELO|nr:unnamed protein product [Caenorhabditis angaria]